jgi:hypothetical protein
MLLWDILLFFFSREYIHIVERICIYLFFEREYIPVFMREYILLI